MSSIISNNPVSRGITATSKAFHSAFVTFQQLPEAHDRKAILDNMVAASMVGSVNFTAYLFEDEPEEFLPTEQMKTKKAH